MKINKSIEILIVHEQYYYGQTSIHKQYYYGQPLPLELQKRTFAASSLLYMLFDEEEIYKILSKHYKNVSITAINSEEDLEKLVIRKPDLVFSGVRYFYFNNRNLWLNDYLEIYDISYITSSRKSLLLADNKNRAKKIMQKSNIKTADFFITTPGKHPNELSIPIKFPLFIKPLSGHGNSKGVDANSVVYDFEKFKAKVLDIKIKQNSYSLVETYLPGKEYSVGIFEDNTDGSLRAMPIEIVVKKNVNGHNILDNDVKINDEEKVIAVTNIKIFNKLSKLAKDSFTALGGKSIGRIDFKMNELGILHFIEANLMPGLQRGYFYRSCVLNLDMNYDEMILKIVNTGLSSQRKDKEKGVSVN